MKGSLEGDVVVVGRVRRPHGVGGEVLVEPLTDVPERFVSGARFGLVDAQGRQRTLAVASVRNHRTQLIVRFDGFEDRDEAADLRGAALTVDSSEIPDAPEGAYYYFQLIGCSCRDEAAGDLGVVKDVVEDGGGLLLSLDLGGRTLLVPFVREYLCDIDLESETIELSLPRGLLESCVSQS